MTDIVLVPVTGGNNISAMNNNFDKIEDAVNNDILHLEGGNNVMKQDIDMNSNSILNYQTDVNNPSSLLTVGDADSRYYNVSGDTLSGNMNAAGNKILNLPVAAAPHEPARKNEVDAANAAQDAITADNKNKSLRVNDNIQAMAENVAARKDKLLSFDNAGNPVAIAAANQSATDLEIRLADSTDPTKGAALIGFKLPLASAVSRNVSGVLFDSFSVLNWIPVAEHAAIRAGSSTFDCGPAIRAAIAAISVNTALYFPYGTYMVGKNAPGDSEAFNINKEGVTFFGEGTLKREENNTGYFARLGADRTALVDLTLDGNRGATGIPDSSGFGATIRSAGFKKCEVRNCRIINSAGQGISAGAGCNEWMVSGNYLENFFSNAIQFAAEASDSEGFSFVRIVGNHIKGDLPSASRFCNGIFLTSSATTTAQNTHFCDHNTISGNVVEDVPDAGIESGYKCRYSVIEGNTIRRSFNANILIRDNVSPIVNGNNIFCRSGHASTNRFGIYVDGLSISGDANPITNCFGVITSNVVTDAEQAGISIIATGYCSVANNILNGVAVNNGSSGINIKSGYSSVTGNIIRNFQNIVRFSLESTRPLGNQIKSSRCSFNIGDLGTTGLLFDATVAMELVDCDIVDNKFRALVTATVGITGTPTYTNTRLYNNIDGDTRQRNASTQATATAVIQSPSSVERPNAATQFGTVTAYDKFVAGVVMLRMGNETALFKTEGDGTLTAISESTNIGLVGSGKLYRLETLTGALVIKRYGASQTYDTFKASLL